MRNTRLAPVAVFAYNRLDKVQNCIKALEKCQLADESELHVFADGSKGEKDREAVESVHSWLKKYAEGNTGFKTVTLHIKDRNAGLANSIIAGVTEVISEVGRIIVVEDDLEVSPFFLKYMNEGLSFYENSPEIWAMASYGYDLKALRRYSHDIYLGYRASSWGWASWKDRWDTVDWEVKDFAELEASAEKQKKFSRGGGDLFPMLQRQMRGESDSWAIRWNYAASKQDKLTVYPKYGLVSNKGFDGSGTHTKGHAPVDILNFGTEVKFEHLSLNPRITREFYLLHTDTLDKKIKRNLSVKNVIKLIRRKLGKG